LIGLLIFLHRMTYSPSKQPQEAVQDMLMVLLPSGIVALAYLLSSTLLRIGQVQVLRKRSAFSKKGQQFKGGAMIVAILMLALVYGSLQAIEFLPPVEWRPSRSEALWMAFAPWVVVLLVMPLILWWYVKATLGASWEQKPSLHRPRTLEIVDEHVLSRDVNVTSVYQWSAFLRYRETENLFILLTEDAMFLMVPKRNLP